MKSHPQGQLLAYKNWIMLVFFFFSAVLGLRCHSGFSLVAVSGLLIAVASLVAEHGL